MSNKKQNQEQKSQETQDSMSNPVASQFPLKDAQGRYRTMSLFHEEISSSTDGYKPVYTLKPEEYRGLPSAKAIYLAACDPTEYRAAMALLGSWEHWQKLLQTEWFMKYLNEWRAELVIKLKSMGLAKAVDLSLGNSGQALAAAKFLVSQGWDSTETRGRPSTAEVQGYIKQQAETTSRMADDLERLNIN